MREEVCFWVGFFLRYVFGCYIIFSISHIVFFPSFFSLFLTAADLKDEEWNSFTTPMRWGTQGMWHENDRRSVNAGATSPDGRLVAIVDESGDLQVFKHPCVDKAAACVKISSHATHATCVRFSCDGKKLYTVGGRDRLLMQFKVTSMS